MKVRAALALLVGALVTACGGGGSSSATPVPYLTATPSPAPRSASPPSTSDSTALACLPVDTPTSRAPADLRAFWSNLGSDTVPACSVLSVTLPPVVNLAASAGVSDEQARQIAEARVRSEQIGNWAARTRNTPVTSLLSTSSIYSADLVKLLSQGAAVRFEPNEPGCAIPARLAIVVVPPEAVAALGAADAGVKAAQPLAIYGVSGGCRAIATVGATDSVVSQDHGQATGSIAVGSIRVISQVGLVWYYIGQGADCGTSSLIQIQCRQVGL